MTAEDIKKEIERMQDVTKDIKVSVGNLRSDINQLSGAIKQDQDDQYQRGYRDAWDLATRITLDDTDGGIPMEELKAVFNTGTTYRIFKDFGCFEIASKLKEYEKKKAEIQEGAFRVGDEVIAPSSDGLGRAVVTKVMPRPNNRTAIEYLYSSGDRGWEYDINLKKTGHHFDEVEKLLEAMRP